MLKRKQVRVKDDYLKLDIQKFADGEISYKVTFDGHEAERTINNLSKKADEVSKKFTNVGKNLTLGVTTPLVGFSTYAVKMASDLSEVQNVVDTTFKESSNTINEFAKNAAEKFGLSELSAKQFTGTMGAMLKSMGLGNQEVTDMSMALAGLAGDMASFYNLDPTEAFEKLRSGISGETEPLKQLGINMSVANLEAFALSKGITKSYDSMTQAEQATLRYQYIMSTTADAQGDYAKTADSTANKTRTTILQFQTLSAELGEQLLPIVNDVLGVLQKMISWFTNLDDNGKKIVLTIAGIAMAIGPVVSIIGNLIKVGSGIKKLVTMMKSWSVVTKLMTAAQTALNVVMSMNPITLIIIAIVALIAIIVLLWTKCEWFRDGVMAVIDAIWSVIQTVAAFIGNIFQTVFNVVSGVFNAIWSVVQMVFNFIWAIVQNYVNFWITVWSTIFNIVSTVLTTIWNTIQSVFNFIWGIISSVINNIISAFKNVANVVKSVFNAVINAIKSVFNGVINIIKAPINGLIGLINGVIKGLNKIKLPDWVPAIGGKGINIPLIPKLATGTNYVAGEGLAYLHEGEAVVPKKYNPAIGGYGNFNQPIYVTVNADMDVNKFGKAFVRDIKTFSGGTKNSYNYGGGK